MELLIAKGKATVLIDEEDFGLVSQYSWSYKDGYACRYRSDKKGFQGRMHRLILGLSLGDPIVDHIDRNPLNNQKSNLRLSNPVLNGQNMRMRKGRIFKGVTWDASKNKWKAAIGFNGKIIHIGRYSRPWHAARAYDKKARELYKNPVLNFA